MPLATDISQVTPILTRYALTGRRDADNAWVREINVDEQYHYAKLTESAALAAAAVDAQGVKLTWRVSWARIQSDDAQESERTVRGYVLDRQISRTITWEVYGTEGTQNPCTLTSNTASGAKTYPFNVTLTKSVSGTRYQMNYDYFDIRGLTARRLNPSVSTANSVVVSIPGPVLLLCCTFDLTGTGGYGEIKEYLYR